MNSKIFVNLPVKDLQKSVHFFTELGYTFNPQFTDEHATSMIVSDDIYVMLLTERRFADFTRKPIVDATAQTETIVALSAESREAVDRLADTALAAGGQPVNDPMDHGFMYGRSFADLDGHQWEILWMDPAAIQR